MGEALAMLLAQKGLDLLAAKLNGPAQTGASVASILLELTGVALTAYEQETGQPMDLSKIKPYVPLD